MTTLRKYTNPQRVDVSGGLQELLMKNGMQAHIVMKESGQYVLVVQGHDSPMLEYPITDEQVERLMRYEGADKKKAYDTFNSIVRNDFDIPTNYTHANEVNSRVVLGLHGYRIGIGEYGNYGVPMYRPACRHGWGWFGDFLGWTPRRQPGYHLRRVEDKTFFANTPMVPVRPDGSYKPGEAIGKYGYYYKGDGKQNQVSQETLDFNPIKPIQAAKRPVGQATPFEPKTPVYFTKDEWKDVLKSHGIIVDEKKKQLIIQSTTLRVDVAYSLTDEEIKKILEPGEKNGKVDYQKSIDTINNVIKKDFDEKLTLDMLKTKDLVGLKVNPEARLEIEKDFIAQDKAMEEQRQAAENERLRLEMEKNNRELVLEESKRISQDPNAVNGKEVAMLLGNVGWFMSRSHGRELVVGEIRVDKGADGKYIMTANINGYPVSHEISEKDYKKFLAVDDKNKLKMFDSVFDEVEIKASEGRTMYEYGPTPLRSYFSPLEIKSEKREPTAQELFDDYLRSKSITYSVNGDAVTLKFKNGTNEISQFLNNKELAAALKSTDFTAVTLEERLKRIDDAFAGSTKLSGADYKEWAAKRQEKESEKEAKEDVTFKKLADTQDASENNKIRVSNSVDGRDLGMHNENKGFFRAGSDGKEIEVGEISVNKGEDGKYRMTAVIDGSSYTREISQKDYQKFLAVDDYHRMKLFASKFELVDLKTKPGCGFNLGAAVLAAFVAVGDVAAGMAGHHHHEKPEFYARPIGAVYAYGKEGVAPHHEVADLQMQAGIGFERFAERDSQSMGESRGRGV